ncbi:hypothetical protein [Kitasatospora sp. NPDC001095]
MTRKAPTIHAVSEYIAVVEAAARGIRRAADDWDAINDGFCDADGNIVDTEGWDHGIVARDLAAWQHYKAILPYAAGFLLRVGMAIEADPADPKVVHSRRALSTAYHSSFRRIDDLIALAHDLDHPLAEEIAADIWHEMNEWADHAPVLVDTYRRQHPGPDQTFRPQDAATARTTSGLPAPTQASTERPDTTTPPRSPRRTP